MLCNSTHLCACVSFRVARPLHTQVNAIETAMKHGHAHCVALLLQSKAWLSLPLHVRQHEESSLLHYATDPAGVAAAVTHGCDKRSQLRVGMCGVGIATPLHSAVARGGNCTPLLCALIKVRYSCISVHSTTCRMALRTAITRGGDCTPLLCALLKVKYHDVFQLCVETLHSARFVVRDHHAHVTLLDTTTSQK